MKTPNRTGRMRSPVLAVVALAVTAGTTGMAMAQATQWPTNLWIGTNGALASVGSNWYLGHSPTNTETVLLDTDASNLTWDAAATNTVASWIQTTNYTGTVTVYTVYSGQGSFSNFLIAGDCIISNGVWTHGDNTTYGSGNTPYYRLCLTVSGNFSLASNAAVNASSKGYAYRQGTGASPSSGAAASYGGQGGRGPSYAAAGTYGSAFAPVDLGSGGYYSGAPGGGAVLLIVNGTTRIDGSVFAKGGTTGSGPGGAGGSIFFTSATVVGAGLLDVSGGAGQYTDGGGGRISIVLTNGISFDSVRIRAYGGNGGQGGQGAAGTIYRQINGQAQGQGLLTIDNNGISLQTLAFTVPSQAMDLSALQALVLTNGGMFVVTTNTSVNFATASIQGGGELKIRSTNNVLFPAPFVLTNGYRLCLDTNLTVSGPWTILTNAVLTHSYSYYGQVEPEYHLSLTINGDLTIAGGGGIDVSSRGYAAKTGLGAGAGDGSYCASHGGQGGHIPGAFSPPTYGSVLQPVALGSGGAYASNTGGGAVRLTVSGNTTLNGYISAKGGPAGGRASSGGSIYITSGTMAGNGSLDASGQTGQYVDGGGGRIAVVLTTGSSFGSIGMTAYGGNDGNGAQAAAGTIYRQAAGVASGAGTVVVDNGTIPTNSTYTPLPAFSNSTENISKTVWVITNKVRLGLVTNVAIASLTLNANGFLELNGYTLTVKALTVTNKVYKSGTYGPLYTQISALTDSGSGGKVIIKPSSTVVYFR